MKQHQGFFPATGSGPQVQPVPGRKLGKKRVLERAPTDSNIDTMFVHLLRVADPICIEDIEVT